MEIVKIEVLNWEKYNGRKGIVNPRWFRFENTFFESIVGLTLTDTQLKGFLYILSRCSKSSSSRVDLDLMSIYRVLKIKSNRFDQLLNKLELLGVIKIHERITNKTVQNLCTTQQDITRQDITKHNKTENSSFFENREREKTTQQGESEPKPITLDDPPVDTTPPRKELKSIVPMIQTDPHFNHEINPDRVVQEIGKIRKKIGLKDLYNI